MIDGETLTFSENFACPEHGVSLPELEPRIFSFNSPHGACPRCTGLGAQQEIDPDLLVPDPTLSIGAGRARPVVAREHELLRVGDPGDRRPLRDRPRAAVAGPARAAPQPLPLRHRGRPRLRDVPQPDGPPALVHARLRGHRPEPAAALQGDGLGPAAGADRGVHELPALPGLQGRAAEAGGARGHRRRAQHPRVHADVRDAGARVRARPGADRRRAADRRPDPEGDPRAADLPRRRRRRLPAARPRVGDALGRRGAAAAARDADRIAARRRALHPRRAVDRAPPARQRQADRRRSSGCATSATPCSWSSTTSR